MEIAGFTGPYRFLSNFYPCQVMFEGVIYPTSEHAFQAAKTFDLGARERIRQAATPGESKRLGRTVVLRHDWEAVKLSVMETILRDKFSSPIAMLVIDNPECLAQKLIATGDDDLVEENHWGDVVWGRCEGVGENNLGKILMKIRQDLHDAASA